MNYWELEWTTSPVVNKNPGVFFHKQVSSEGC